MKYSDLRDFILQLETRSLLQRVDYPVSPYLEMTAVSDKVLRAGGKALLFTHPKDHHILLEYILNLILTYIYKYLLMNLLNQQIN